MLESKRFKIKLYIICFALIVTFSNDLQSRNKLFGMDVIQEIAISSCEVDQQILILIKKNLMSNNFFNYSSVK
jgi:hypothetical protein